MSSLCRGNVYNEIRSDETRSSCSNLKWWKVIQKLTAMIVLLLTCQKYLAIFTNDLCIMVPVKSFKSLQCIYQAKAVLILLSWACSKTRMRECVRTHNYRSYKSFTYKTLQRSSSFSFILFQLNFLWKKYRSMLVVLGHRRSHSDNHRQSP